ncbi:hypothetical protein ACFLSZ_01495 [Candidatus Bipolaricaulota bacterium]
MESVHAIHGCCCGDERGHKAVASHCCGPTRRFISKAERREGLEKYIDQLKKELAGVEERLQDLG